MPKMKSKRAACKRFKLTGSGNLRRQKAFRRHILTKKTTKQKRNLRGSAAVSPADTLRVMRMLAIA